MSTHPSPAAKPRVKCPDSEGQPVAHSTLQFRWIVTLQGGLDALFRDDPRVFVGGDLMWYPLETDHALRTAPDVMVVFGRPKGERGAYRQWAEGGVAPQVVFEVLSPERRFGDLMRKFQFYERFGVEEYYVYDPDHSELTGWVREGDRLEELLHCDGWVSPRLGIRFDLSTGELRVFRPDGQPFDTYVELVQQSEQQRQQAERWAAQLRGLGVEPAAGTAGAAGP